MTRFALAGAGWMGTVHALALAALPRTELVAVASRTAASADRLAGEYSARTLDYEALPGDADVVVVATPPERHAQDALFAVAGGAAALVEKPLCTRLVDADRLVRVADAGAVVGYAENLLFAEAVSRALAEIAALGPLRHLTVRSLQPRPTWGDFTSRGWGGGVLFDLGAHPLALALRAAGSEPAGVRAVLEGSDDIEVDDRASVELRFDSGLLAQVEASWRDPAPVWDLQAASDSGVVFLSLLPELSLERDGEPIDLPPPPEGDHSPQLDRFGYVEQLRDIAAAQRVGRPPTVSDVHFGREVLEVTCAAYLAARAGGEVALPYAGPRDRTPIELWRPAEPASA